MTLTGKCALVCGSTQGIGFACATALADAGASVVLVARNRERLAAAAAALPLRSADQRHATITADFSDPGAARHAVEQWMAAGNSIHVLVNNSGGPPGGPITDATPEQFLAALGSHLLANHLLAQAVIPGMRAAGYGRIVNIVSTSVKQPIPGLGVSNTTRGAVASWAKTLAGEVARDGITVNNVLPGATRTARLTSIVETRARAAGRPAADIEHEMLSEIPAGRFAEPAEIAAAVAFLAGPAAGYITGVSLAVDGGRTTAL
jgi:3-oxoacyl-[acyl-carrier protein] reductase